MSPSICALVLYPTILFTCTGANPLPVRLRTPRRSNSAATRRNDSPSARSCRATVRASASCGCQRSSPSRCEGVGDIDSADAAALLDDVVAPNLFLPAVVRGELGAEWNG